MASTVSPSGFVFLVRLDVGDPAGDVTNIITGTKVTGGEKRDAGSTGGGPTIMARTEPILPPTRAPTLSSA